MNRINLIELNSHHQEKTGLLFSIISTLSDELQIVKQDDFIAAPNDHQKGINIFLFDQYSLKNLLLRHTVMRYLNDNSQQINLCLFFEAETIFEEPDIFSSFYDFLMWPCNAQEIRARLLKFLPPKKKTHEQETTLLQEFSRLHLTGESPIFIKTISLIKRIASCHATVLVQGETGTGKENAARAIHYLSDRRDHAFIAVNCAAIPDELLESELFGHEKGSFTDAKTKQHGLISLAQDGTLFLDEVDSLSPKAQASLLRFLQTQEYRPLGSKITLQADVRIIAATNANLKALAEQKLFREDLYFRLNVLQLEMPALRNRRQDIPLIVAALIERFSQQYSTPVKKIHPQTLNFLMNQPWAGNIRELENVLLRHFLLSNESIIHIENHSYETDNKFTNSEPNILYNSDTKTHIDYNTSNAIHKTTNIHINFQDAKAKVINEFEEHYLKELMLATEGNVSAAARISGKERRALGKLLQKHHIQKHAPHAVTS